eukprot:COSAG06_NODE_2587_length_6615_cov_25.876918_3_plen_766_part_00
MRRAGSTSSLRDRRKHAHARQRRQVGQHCHRLSGARRPLLQSDSEDTDDSDHGGSDEDIPRTADASRSSRSESRAPRAVHANSEQRTQLQVVADLSAVLRHAERVEDAAADASHREASLAETRERQSAAACVVLTSRVRESCFAVDLALLLLIANDGSIPRGLRDAERALRCDDGKGFVAQPQVLASLLLFGMIHRLLLDVGPQVAAQERSWCKPALSVAARETHQELHRLLQQHQALQEEHETLLAETAEQQWAAEELRSGIEDLIEENQLLRGEVTEGAEQTELACKATAANLQSKLHEAQAKLQKSRERSLHSRGGANFVPLGDVEGWATLRTQLQLARAEADQAEEEALALRSQLSAARKQEGLHQHASDAILKASRECTVEIRTLRADKKRLERELAQMPDQRDVESQLTAKDQQRIAVETDAARFEAERDALAGRLREAERCVRAGAAERVHLEDEAEAALARCEQLEAKVVELGAEAFASRRGKVQAIESLSADADSVARQLQALQAAADSQADQAQEQRAARVVAEDRAVMLGQEVVELRSELEATQKELRELRASTTAAAAAAVESQQQATQHAANQAVRRWKQQLASQVFGGWADNVARSRSIRIVAARVVSRMQHRSTDMALSAWRAEVARRQRTASKLSQCIRKIRNAAVCAAFAAWRADTLDRRRLAAVVKRSLARICNQLVYSVLFSWHSGFLARRRQEAVVRRTIARMGNLALQKTLTSWHSMVSTQQRAQGIVLRCLARLTMMAVTAAW